jgi:DNA polymerase-3 subunit delta'
LLIKLGQVRTIIGRAQTLPSEGPAKVFVLTSAALMKEAANSLLKLLEEPPAYVHIVILAENLGELLPTIRSRCAVAHLGALPVEEIAGLLAERRPEWNRTERELTARLSEGAVGRAMGFNLAEYAAARADALTMLQTAERAGAASDHAGLFKMTESYRAGAEGQVKTTALLRAMSSLLEDMLLLQGGAAERVRNVDKRAELQRMADTFDFAWIEGAVRAMDGVQSGMRRNLLRGLSLDAMAVGMERQ